MNLWRPYLLDLMGNDEHGRARVRETETLAGWLLSERLTAQDLLGLFDWIEELDAFRQVFILPTVLELLDDPSRSLRSRILRFAGELVGASFGPLLANVDKMTQSERGTDKRLHDLLGSIVEIFGERQGDEDEGDVDSLATLLDDRATVFALSLLEGLYRWIEDRPPDERLRRVYADFFAEDEQAAVRERLLDLLSEGPLFVRHLIVRWIGRAGTDLSSEATARQLLFTCYCKDPAPVVAAAAVEGYSRLTEASDVAASTKRLEDELRTFSERRRGFHGSGLVPPSVAWQYLSASLLGALGVLARLHPSEPAPLAALRRVVTARPSGRVDLFQTQPARNRQRIFDTALALRGDVLRFRIRRIRRDGNRLVGELGLKDPVLLEQPHGSLRQGAEWCELATTVDSHRRRFRLVEAYGGGPPATKDLLGVIAPRIEALATWKPPRQCLKTLGERCERELADRAIWSCAAVDAVAGALLAVHEMQDAAHESHDVVALVTFLVQTAEAAEQVSYREDVIGADGRELRNQTRGTLLNRFATREFFDNLFAEGEADPVRARLLTRLATSAMRSLDHDVAYRWITSNLGLLRRIAESQDYPLFDRAAAAAAVQLRIRDSSEEDGEERIVIDHDAQDIRGDTIRALPFIADAKLRDTYLAVDARTNRTMLISSPEQASGVDRQVAVRSEVLARALESGDGRWGNVDDDLAICLAVAALPDRSDRPPLLSDTARRRLMMAFVAASPESRKGQVRRLFEQLLRTATSAQLLAVLRLALRRREPELDAYLGRRMQSRLREAKTASRTISGQHLDAQTIVDLSARRSVLLTFLYHLAHGNQEFLRDYLRWRRDQRGSVETDRVTAATAVVRRIRGIPDDRLPVELRPLRRGPAGHNMVETAADIVPTFVYHARGQTDVRCLAVVRRAPKGVVNLHVPNLALRNRRALLDELLSDQKSVRLVAYVAGNGTGGRKLLDLGVSLAGSPMRMEVAIAEDLKPDDPVVVQVRRETGRKLVVGNGQFELYGDRDSGDIIDLRRRLAPVGWLERNVAQRTVLLRCTVGHRSENRDGTVRCFCDAGFRLYDRTSPNGRQPSFVAPMDEAPATGAEVVVAAWDFSFGRIEADGAVLDSIEVVSAGTGLQEGQRVHGYLRHQRPAGGRRRWFAEVGGVRLDVPRRHLTRDLRRVFALDELPDGALVLKRLSGEALEFRVLRGGKRASLVEAEPSWTVEDLVVAVASGAVERVTVVSIDHGVPPGMIVEVEAATPMVEDLGDGPVLSLGTLSHIGQGELFDQQGEPVAIEALSPGTRLNVAVWERGSQVDGGAGERPRPAIHLRLTEDPDEENIRLETMFSERDVVKVRVSDDGSMELAEAFQGLPRPPVKLAWREEQRFFQPSSTVDAEVARSWDPWSTDPVIKIQRLRAAVLHIDSANPVESVRFYLEMENGDRIGRRCRYRYESGGLFCSTGGLRVRIDSLTPYLLPDAPQLRPEQIASDVILTEVGTRVWRRYESLPLNSVPGVARGEALTGLVVQTPSRQSDSTQIQVCWVRGDLDDDGQNSVSIHNLPLNATERYFNGDVLEAYRQGDRIAVDRRTRYLKGTFLHTPRSVHAWMRQARRERRETVEAVLLERPEDVAEPWLFCGEPADLVEVPPEVLREVHDLGAAQPLDRVRLRLVRTAEGDDALQVESTAPGDLARARGARLELRIDWYDRSSGTFQATLSGTESLARYPPLELKLRHTDLPPGENGGHLARRIIDLTKRPAKERQPIVVACTLERFELRAWRDGAAWRFELDCTLGRFQANRVVPARMVKPPLMEALAVRGRLDGARGKIVEHDGADAVRLTGFAHPVPVPLPLKEQSWLPFTGKFPRRGTTFPFTVLPGDEGAAYASLRRNRPKTLSEWLASRRYRTPSARLHVPMRYFGPMSDQDRTVSGIASEADEGDAKADEATVLVLFEVGPGETFAARSDQLLFLGEPFDPKTLHAGDEVSELQVVGRLEEGDAKGEPILDILTFTLDIVEDLKRFKGGSHFGRIAVVDGRVEIIELRGASYNKKRVTGERLGRWRLVLEGVSEEGMDRLQRLGQEQYVYLRFIRADRVQGTLIFQLADPDSIFAPDSFVYVAAKKVAPYGPASSKLEVRPLDPALKGDYFIPESLFSERRGRLHSLARAHEGGIFLARVHEVPEEGIRPGLPGSSYKLTLLENPRRRFRYMMSHQEWQVIVKEQSRDGRALYAEAGIGVNVELPLHRIGLGPDPDSEGDAPPPHVPKPGEILFLERLMDERRLVIRDSVPGHVDYLAVDQRPLVLTSLWGSDDYRRRRIEKKQDLDCSIIGLPQLHGSCRVKAESVALDGPLPQQVDRLVRKGRGVLLTDRLGWGSDVVGRLSFDDTGQPRFETTNTGKTYLLPRAETTFREGTTREVAKTLASHRWRNTATDDLLGIADSDLIGTFLKEEGTVSLTAMAQRPFPVDHVVEQFADPGSVHRKKSPRRPRPRYFVVARVERQRVILEIAPGRYAELPSALISPLHDKLAPGMSLSWNRLAPGDEVSLELLPSPDSDAFFPKFRVKELIARSGRQLARPLAVPLCRREDRSLFLGTVHGPGVAAPILGSMLKNEIHDLKEDPNVGRRYFELKRLSERHGSRLVLKGRIVGSTEVGEGRLFFIDIGIQVPIDGGRKDPRFLVPAGDLKPQRDDVVGVRVFDTRFSNATLDRFHYAVEPSLKQFSDSGLVRGAQRAFTRAGRARVGDSVLVYRPEGGTDQDAVVAGFEHFEVVWRRTEGDDLHLESASERKEVFKRLLAHGGSFWATCEAVGERRLTLSRRRQLDDVLPAPGDVVRGKLDQALSNNRWLVWLYEVPMVLLSNRLFRGPTSAVGQLSDEYARTMKRGLDMEITRAQDGRLSTLEVYKLPATGELSTRIEAVVESGVMVVGAGCRLFVPATELTWCGELDDELLRSLFRRGDRLRVARVRADRDDRWSHTKIYDIRTHVAEMTRTQGAVTVTAVDAGRKKPTIVRASSGALMQLKGGPPPEPGTRLVAFVQHVDEVNRRIVLAPNEAPHQIWNFSQMKVSRARRIALHSEPAFRARLRELEAVLADQGISAVYSWARRHPGIGPDPENVRIVLDLIGSQTELAAAEEPQEGTSDTDLARLLGRLTDSLAGHLEDPELSSNERFALGYRLLLDGRAEDALLHLAELQKTKQHVHSFAARLALAVAYARTGKRSHASHVVRELLSRLFANAVRTITIPLIEPESFDPQDDTRQQWEDAVVHGDLDRLEAMVGRQSADFRTSSSGLAFQVWRCLVENRTDGLEGLVDRFFDALRQDRVERGDSLDPRVFVLAALLDFSRGNVVEAWGWLNRIEVGTANLEVPVFWRRYLDGEVEDAPGLDPLLVAAANVYRHCRWQREVDLSLLEELWERFRASRHRWTLDIPICQPLTPFPEPEKTAVERWVKLNAMEASYDGLIEEMDIEPDP